MAVKQSVYSPRQVAESLAVSESSVKRWCDSGEISTFRTSGGHRRISAEGLQQFLGSSNRSLVNPDVLGVIVRPVNRSQRIPGSDEAQLKQFREALTAGRENECLEVFGERVADGWSVSEAAEDLISDAMCGVGSAWVRQEVDVYQERRACGICMRLINEMRNKLPVVSDDAPVAIGGSPSGDPYEIPTALVELSLREIGWQAVNLGCNLPMSSFLQAAQDYNPKLVWLSVSTMGDVDEFVSSENVMADLLDDETILIVGGRALSDAIRPKLRYTAHCDSVRHLTELASSLKSNYG